MHFKMVTNSTENQFVKVLNQAGQICYKLICNSKQFILFVNQCCQHISVYSYDFVKDKGKNVYCKNFDIQVISLTHTCDVMISHCSGCRDFCCSVIWSASPSGLWSKLRLYQQIPTYLSNEIGNGKPRAMGKSHNDLTDHLLLIYWNHQRKEERKETHHARMILIKRIQQIYWAHLLILPYSTNPFNLSTQYTFSKFQPQAKMSFSFYYWNVAIYITDGTDLIFHSFEKL